MSDPSDKLRQFLAGNSASRELAELLMERDRRRGIKPPVIRDGRSIRMRTKGMRGFVDLALEDRKARKKTD